MRSVLMRNRFTVVVLAGVLAVGVVSPAVGGPSLGKLVDKALNKAGNAKKKARKANQKGKAAQAAAEAADGKAQEGKDAAAAAQTGADLALSRIPKAVFVESDTNESITVAGVNEVLAAEITVDIPSRLIVSSNAEIDADGGNNDDAFCYQSMGNTNVGADDISNRVTVDIPDTNLERGNIANHGSRVVAPGTHTVYLMCGVNVGGQVIQFDSGDMHVVAIHTDEPLP